MSNAEILAQLPHLKAEERSEVFTRLCELQDHDLIHGIGPSLKERKMLEQALAAFEQDRHVGLPWREVLRQVRDSRPA